MGAKIKSGFNLRNIRTYFSNKYFSKYVINVVFYQCYVYVIYENVKLEKLTLYFCMTYLGKKQTVINSFHFLIE